MSEHEIKDLLERAGDDRGRPLRTGPEELLERARRDVGRRRRVLGVVGSLAAAAVIAGVILVPLLSVGREAPVAPRPTEGPALSAATVVERCRPQLAKYAGLAGYDSDPVAAFTRLGHEGRHYRAGDLVQLRLGDQNGFFVSDPVLCVIPHAGEELQPVGFDDLTPTEGNTDLLRAVCAEQAGAVGDGGVRIPDLRAATVVSTSFVGRVGAAVLRGSDGHFYGCATSPPQWGADGTAVARVRSSPFLLAYTDTRSYAVFTGSFGTRARTLELTARGVATRTFAAKGGRVAAVLRLAVEDRLTPVTWRVLAADGRVLDHGEVR